MWGVGPGEEGSTGVCQGEGVREHLLQPVDSEDIQMANLHRKPDLPGLLRGAREEACFAGCAQPSQADTAVICVCTFCWRGLGARLLCPLGRRSSAIFCILSCSDVLLHSSPRAVGAPGCG